MSTPEPSPTPAAALSIAGSDSGGGAGIQADLKTFAAHGVYGLTVVTALTAQDTNTVRAVELVTADMFDAQLEAVTADFVIGSTKIGMIGTSANMATVARKANTGALGHVVVDPVVASSTGFALLDESQVHAYLVTLLPMSAVFTPNISEAQTLTGIAIDDLASMEAAGRHLAQYTDGAVVITGGHLMSTSDHEFSRAVPPATAAGTAATTASPAASNPPASTSPDLVIYQGEVDLISDVKVETLNDHGTGCTFSAAIAANLAQGYGVVESIISAKGYVTQCLIRSAGWQLGQGRGPLGHMSW